MEDILYWLFLIIASVYALMIFTCTISWLTVNQIKFSNTKKFNTRVSVIIAARNEENAIGDCINDLINQNYPKELFELIIVDDASNDATLQLVENIIKCNSGVNIKLIKLADDPTITSPKKRALSEAIKIAGGTLIITTDADCRMGCKWLSAMVSFYEQNSSKMIIGPVNFYGEQNIFQKMQSLEFTNLIGITGATAFLNQPVMCNGANLAYEKEAFMLKKGFENIDTKASGDDIFLMLKFKKMFNSNSIHFIKSKEALVYTSPKTTVSEFLNQRKRWASKSSSYRDFGVIILAACVSLFSISIIFSLGLSFFSNKFTELFFIMTGIKYFTDFTFLLAISFFFEKKKLLWLVILQQVLYPIYVVTIGIAIQFSGYKWKDRKLY